VSQLRYPPLCWPGCGPGGQRSRPSFHTQVNKFRCLLWIEPQSKQSAKLFLQSSELGLPQPLTCRLLCPPSFFRLRERGWGSPNSDERTYTVGTLYIYVLFGLNDGKMKCCQVWLALAALSVNKNSTTCLNILRHKNTRKISNLMHY
jgi:hypothetical protein